MIWLVCHGVACQIENSERFWNGVLAIVAAAGNLVVCQIENLEPFEVEQAIEGCDLIVVEGEELKFCCVE